MKQPLTILEQNKKRRIEVKIANNRKLLKTFIKLPDIIYKDDPLWVPQIRLLEKLDYYHEKNAVLSRSKHRLLLAFSDGKPVGRVIAYIDPRFNEHYSSTTGFFGAFEAINDPAISIALFDYAESWLKKQGITEVRGPIDPIAECWGFLLSGNTTPVFMSPHNPFYYNKLAEASDYVKIKDLLVFSGDCGKGYMMPERLTSFSDKILLSKKNITVRRIDPSNIDIEAGHILRILNTAVRGNWGFVPVGEDEMHDLVAKLKLILDKDVIWFVEDAGVPIGCALGYPDINVLIKEIDGSLFPFGFIRFLQGLKKIRDYRLWGLAIMPEYHGLGLDVLLYVSLFRALKPKKIRLEANYVLEDNMKIINALKKLNLNIIKTYRVYQKKI